MSTTALVLQIIGLFAFLAISGLLVWTSLDKQKFARKGRGMVAWSSSTYLILGLIRLVQLLGVANPETLRSGSSIAVTILALFIYWDTYLRKDKV